MIRRRSVERPQGRDRPRAAFPRHPCEEELEMAEATSASGRTFRMPHTLVIVGSLIFFVLVLAWLVPSGTYQTVEKAGRTVTVPGTYQVVPKVWLGPQWLVIAPIKGFLDGALIIAFLLLIGGAFSVI